MFLKHHCSFFSDFNRTIMSNICKLLVQKVFEKGQVIYEPGHDSTEMFIVLSGEVTIINSIGLAGVKTENS